jgi:hypothetical protein
MNIIAVACEMAQTVEVFIQKAKRFFYSVMLMGHACPQCKGSLVMAAEGKCQCKSCSHEFDPTIEFQRCPECNGKPILLLRRYHCQHCMTEVQSRFLFNGLIFNPEYFKQKMAESRKRKEQKREEVRKMLTESRSDALELDSFDLNSMPDLVEALNQLTNVPENLNIDIKTGFDLKCYEQHIKDHLRDYPINLTDIPPLSENLRKDLIWRFIAVIFLAHAGIVDVTQEGQQIKVIRHETNREGQGVFGESEETNGIEGSVGRFEA